MGKALRLTLAWMLVMWPLFSWVPDKPLAAPVPQGILSAVMQAPPAAAPSISLVAHCVAAGTGTCTINSTGATLIVVQAVMGGSTTFSDPTENKSNTFQKPAAAAWTYTSNNAGQIYYIYNPTVGASHTFTGHTSGCTYFVSAWSGTDTTSAVYDTGSGSALSGTSVQPGSITPAGTNELIVSVVINSDSSLTWTKPTNFTELDPSAVYGRETSAYYVYPSASAINPTWTIGGPVACGTAQAAFKHS